MADEAVNSVLSGEEEGEQQSTSQQASDDTGDFTDLGGGGSQGLPTPQTAPTAPATATATPSTGNAAQPAKASGRALFLGNLLKTILGGLNNVRNAPGNPNNAFDRGFMANSPNQQAITQANISKAKSAADLEQLQVSLTGMKALQYEYLLKRLPAQTQEQHLKQIGDFKQALIKDGANVEAEGDDERASDAQAAHLNTTDQRATIRAGRFYSLPTMDSSGKPKFDVVYVPNKDTLQSDFKWTDPDGNEQTIPAGTPFSGALGKFVEEMQKGAQNQTKDAHKEFAKALNPQIPESEINSTVGYLEDQKNLNTPLYQQNKQQADARINSLRAAQKETAQAKERVAAAGAARIEERQLTGKQAIVDTPDGPVQMSAKEAQEEHGDDFTTLSSSEALKNRDKRANADASMNALTNYEKTFAGTKLSPADKDAMRQIVLQAHNDAGKEKGGILADILEGIPIAGPLSSNLNQYVDRLIKGGIQSGSWAALDGNPQAKTLMTQYFLAVVANFANLKQTQGSIPRNPMMLQAEMNTVPLPYLDRQSAQSAFNTKLSDLKQRNVSIPRIKGQPTGEQINRDMLWKEEGNRERKE